MRFPLLPGTSPAGVHHFRLLVLRADHETSRLLPFFHPGQREFGQHGMVAECCLVSHGKPPFLLTGQGDRHALDINKKEPYVKKIKGPVFLIR